MDGVVEDVEAGDKPDLLQGTLIQWFVLGTALLLDEAGCDQTDIFAMFCWVSENVKSFQLVAFGLKEV